MKRPSKRAFAVAKKILASEGVVPARLRDSADKPWTLQWSELRALALAVKSASTSAAREPGEET